MSTRAARRLTPEDRRLVERAISTGSFRDLDEFEDFAVRRAIALLRLDELMELRPPRPLTVEKILRETRSVRREMARERKAKAVP